MSAGPITTVLLKPSAYSTTSIPLSRDAVAVAVIDSTLEPTKIPESRVLSGTIRDVARDGTVQLDTDAGSITVRLPDRVTATPGQSVQIQLADNSDGAPVPKLATLSENIPSSQGPPKTTPTIESTATSRPTDIYTPSPRGTAPATTTSPSPSVPIDILAQTTLPPKFAPGTTVPAQPVSLPESARILEQGQVQNIFLTLKLPPLTSFPPPVLPSNILNSNGLLSFLIPNNLNSPITFGTSNFLFNPNNNPGIFPNEISLGPPTLLSTLSTPLTADSLPSLRPTINLLLQLTLNSIQTTLTTTLSTPGSGPFTHTLFATTPPNHVSTSMAPGFIILNSDSPFQSLIGTSTLYGDAPLKFLTVNTRGQDWTAGSVFTAHATPPPSLPVSNLSLTPSLSLPSLFGPIDDIMVDLVDLNLNFQNINPVRLALPTLAVPQNFGTSIFLFLAALQSRDLNGFLGDATVNAFKRSGRGDRLEKLDGLFQRLKSAISPATTDWKSFLIPVQTDQSLLPIMVHMKSDPDSYQRDQDKNMEDTKKSDKRVIIDMTFDRMGGVQVDMRMPNNIPRLDTILRTELPLSRAMQEMITRVYAGAMEKTRLMGDIIFQGDPKKWVTITPDNIQEIKMTA